jgi:hypothetical protein
MPPPHPLLIMMYYAALIAAGRIIVSRLNHRAQPPARDRRADISIEGAHA